MMDPRERRAVALLHALGLLGVTGIGWFAAAVFSALRLITVSRNRAALLTLQAAQAALYQLASGTVLLLLLMLAAAGFLVLGAEITFLPGLPVVDPFSVGGTAVLLVWLASLIAVPVWFVYSLLLALRAARRSAGGEIYAYPFIGHLVWEEAPRLFRWLVIEQEPEESGDEDGQTSAPNEPGTLLESPP